MSEVIVTESVRIVSTLFVMLIGVLGTWLTAMVVKRTELTNVGQAMNELIAMAQQTVGELEQTVVQDLKAASVDGKLTNDEIAALRQSVLEITIRKLSNPAKNVLEAASVDIQALITSAAEDWIHTLRNAEQAGRIDPGDHVDAIGFNSEG